MKANLITLAVASKLRKQLIPAVFHSLLSDRYINLAFR